MKNVTDCLRHRWTASLASSSRSFTFIIVCLLCLIFFVVRVTPTSNFTSGTATFNCRSNIDIDFRTIERFTDNMCAQCLWYMAGSETPWKNFDKVNLWEVKYNFSESISVLVCTPECRSFSYRALAAPIDERTEAELNISITITESFKSYYFMDILLNCCENARACCEEMEASPKVKPGDCPAKWDGFMCWPSARPGSINFSSCPVMTYVPLSVKPSSCRNEMAAKECWSNGTWSRIWKAVQFNNETRYYSEEYTDYMRCSTPGATHRLRFIRVSTYVYILSLVLTLFGLGLLFRFGPKKKASSRNLVTIHINFLLSLIFTSSFSIMVLMFIKEPHYKLNSMIDDNPIWCRLLILGKKATRLTNYCWMLNEGIILTQMIVTALKKINMLKFYLIGWLLPAVIMSIYTLIHSQAEFNTGCWTKSMGHLENIYNVPPIAFIITNIVCLIYIIYILIRKLASSEDQSYLWAGVKASLVMVPVFGIQYAFYIVPFDPFESCTNFLFIAQYLLLVMEAMQGAIVAIVFCFLNKDVQQNVKRHLQIRHYLRNYQTRARTEIVELTGNLRR